MDERINDSATVSALRKRVDTALQAGRPRELMLRMLEQLLRSSAPSSEDETYARRHLAALLLERNPWQAALHLRRVLSLDARDDGAFALMGLSQALLGNHRLAVRSYRQALALNPANPWYLHNLGHLLDVALDSPGDALGYLRRAHSAEPNQDEVAASLAHCLARVGKREEALRLARALTQRNPGVRDLCALRDWIEQGAPTRPDGTAVLAKEQEAGRAALGASSKPPRAEPILERVGALLRASMKQAGRDAAALDRAQALCRDYVRSAERAANLVPSTLAAAVEYALARIDQLPVTQRDVAARHRVSVSSLRVRYARLRSALSLVPSDPRYR